MTIRKELLPYTKHFIRRQDIERVVSTLDSGWVAGNGGVSKMFEEEVARYTGYEYAIAVNSATSGLFVATRAMFWEADKDVRMAALTFVATPNMLASAGQESIRLEDVEPFTLVRNGIDVGVSFAGYPVTGCAIADDAHRLAPGMDSDGNTISVLSFHPAKHITTGEGGMILTDNRDMYREMKQLVDQGRGRGNVGFGFGFNFRMSDINAALGLSQLQWHDDNLHWKREIAEMYTRSFSGFNDISPPFSHRNHSWHLYVVRFPSSAKRDWFRAKLREYNIGTQIHYPHLSSYDHLRSVMRPRFTPVADHASNCGLSIPMFSSMNRQDVQDVADAFYEIYQEYVRERELDRWNVN